LKKKSQIIHKVIVYDSYRAQSIILPHPILPLWG